MIENGFYVLDKSYGEPVRSYNGEFEDQKSRPVFCCLKDKSIEGSYRLIRNDQKQLTSPAEGLSYAEYNNLTAKLLTFPNRYVIINIVLYYIYIEKILHRNRRGK